jgi:urea transport system permease protein
VDRVTQDWQLIVGVILVIVVLFLPDGLVSLLPKKFLSKKSNQLDRIE